MTQYIVRVGKQLSQEEFDAYGANKYKVVSSTDAKMLSIRVETEMDDGWTPIGGLASVACGNYTNMLFQALMRI